MSTTKAFILAGITAVSLGLGQAMAQDGGGAVSDYWSQEYRAEAARAALAHPGVATVQPAEPQFGGSDAGQRGAPFNVDTNVTEGGF